MENISDREIDDDVLSKAPTKQLTGKILATTDKVKEKLGDIDADNAMEVILAAPRRLKKELRKMSVIGTLTRFPAPTVAICLLITMFFLFHSGILDKWTGTTSLNVNGDLEVYLP
ncbi:MAG: hypothetical protein QF885_04390, partial [Candidatus Thalassarchaeaceae archaeon]|nr:hypothetical protein [Candidatus Thalassarchaeaceae archaeon]